MHLLGSRKVIYKLNFSLSKNVENLNCFQQSLGIAQDKSNVLLKVSIFTLILFVFRIPTKAFLCSTFSGYFYTLGVSV